jgi:diguanylate cyclase (GGDEF)-like protein
LLHQAFHDPLTGLPNRLLLLDRLTQALSRLARRPSIVSVIYLDIDRFRMINDSLGHTAGDQLLQAVAARLGDLIRPEDTLARTGGDEFVVLCEGLSGEDEAVTVADRICSSVQEPLAWNGEELVISMSAGIALATSAMLTPETLLRDADAAMYTAKRERRTRCAVYVATMRDKAAGRLDTEMSLRRSIEDGDLRLHYQQIVSLVDGRVLGHEALVRWAHPTRGLVAPDQFITIAEESGLIVPLGAWVLREACRQAKKFQTRDERWADLTMSVNLSGRQLGQVDLADMVGSALREAELSPEHLQLEMTESVLMDDAATTITILQTLKDLGLRLGVDDFGTGYSSLAYLRRFPVDVLKIDRSFIDGLGNDLEDSAIVAALVSLADTLGLTTIAEGVETDLQRESLLVLGCTRAQGYLFGRPVAAHDAEKALDHTAEILANMV